MRRVPEPELMDAADQALAYAQADFSEPNALFVERVLAADPPPQARVVDLGCGPGDIALRLAAARPSWSVVGVDGSDAMLAHATQALAARGGGGRVRFERGLVPDAPLGQFDVIVSNSLLHHLPTGDLLWRAVRRLAAPNAIVMVMDLRRPPSQSAASALVERESADAPEVLRRDFCASLCAAWTPAEVQVQLQAAGLGHLRVETPTDRHLWVSGPVQPPAG